MKLIEKGYKMLVCDFDLSLSKTDRTISQRTIDAIKQFQREGGVFGICTGRALPSLNIIFKEYGLSGFKISYHGSIVLNEKGEVISDTYMSSEEAFDLLKIINPNNKSFFIAYIDDKIYCNRDGEIRQYYMNMTKVEVLVKEDLKDWFTREELKVRKILIIDNEIKIKEIMKESEDRLPDYLQVSISDPRFIEAVHIDSTKGAAVKKIAEYYGIPLENVAAVGDSSIDVSMLQIVGGGIAVKNADQETKRLSEYVSEHTCDEDAVYHILEECAFTENTDKPM